MNQSRLQKIENEQVHKEEKEWTREDTKESMKLILFIVCLFFIPLTMWISFFITVYEYNKPNTTLS